MNRLEKPRKPTRREQELMTLMSIDKLENLEKFLNLPSRPGLASQSRPPDEELDLLNEERQKEQLQENLELLYGMSNPLR
jgi:hypothetical protein